jgi:cyanophycin synthetase
MNQGLNCKIAYFSMDEHNHHIILHTQAGGLAAVFENGYVTIMKGTWKIRVEKVTNIPLTFGGKAEFNIANVLPAILAAHIRNFKIEDVRLALQTFIPSPVQTPGRMNMFDFKHFKVLVDYAHNAHGLSAIGKFIAKIDATKKTGIIAGVGDRRDEDTIQLGEYAAKIFDEIIIRQDRNLRGKTDKEIIDLMLQGIHNISPTKKVKVIPKESEAIDYAIKHATKGSFITICSDVVPDALEQIMNLREAEG